MARSGRHAVADNSFARSAGSNMLRGVGLLAVAVVLGLILLNATDNGDPFDRPVVAGRSATTTTRVTRPDETTTSTAPLRPPTQVKVLTANGTETSGVGARFKDL